MHWFRLFVVTAATGCLACGANAELVFVGSGGCDGADHSCVPNPAEEQVVRAFEIQPGGVLTPQPQLAYHVDGQPAWLTSFHTGDKQCLFVLRADKDNILPLVVDSASGELQVVGEGSVQAGGLTPVFADVVPAGTPEGVNTLVVANYNGGDTIDGASAASFSIHSDCSLQLVHADHHSGSSVDHGRQRAAHVHSTVYAPYGAFGRLVYACDLGMDKVFAYRVMADGGLMRANEIDVSPGVGPRHIAQHPSKDVVYVVTEMGMTVLVFRQQNISGQPSLSLSQTLDLVPENASRSGSKAAEILVHPDGSAVYASNRGELNTVTVFLVAEDGSLAQEQLVDVPAYPRGMELALQGEVLLVAGQSQGEIAAFRVGAKGLLEMAPTIVREGVPPSAATFAFVNAVHDQPAALIF